MKKLLYILPMIVFGYATAQTGKQPVGVAPVKDSMSVNRQLQKESDMKTMDAVKTKDHEKIVPTKPKNASKKDTTKVKKRVQH
jgi:hypothetical protein